MGALADTDNGEGIFQPRWLFSKARVRVDAAERGSLYGLPAISTLPAVPARDTGGLSEITPPKTAASRNLSCVAVRYLQYISFRDIMALLTRLHVTARIRGMSTLPGPHHLGVGSRGVTVRIDGAGIEDERSGSNIVELLLPHAVVPLPRKTDLPGFKFPRPYSMDLSTTLFSVQELRQSLNNERTFPQRISGG